MAKKKNRGSGIFRKAEANISALERALKSDRMGDFRHVSGLNESLWGNLAGLTKSQGRKLTSANRRIMGQMKAIMGKQQAGKRRVGEQARQAEGAYGGALADVVGQEFAGARATAKVGTGVAKAQVQEGRRGGQTARDVLSIAESGAREAEAGAAGQLADALGARTEQDVSQVAEMRQQVLMAKLQHQLQLEMQEKQAQEQRRMLRFEQNLLQEQAGPQTAMEVNNIASDLSQATVHIRAILEDDPSLAGDANAVLEELKTKMGEFDEAYLPVYKSLVMNVIASPTWGERALGGTKGRNAGVAAIMATVRAAYPGRYDEYKKNVERIIRGTLSGIYSAPAEEEGELPGWLKPWGRWTRAEGRE